MNNKVVCIKDRLFLGTVINKQYKTYNILGYDDGFIYIDCDSNSIEGFPYSLNENSFVQFDEYFIKTNHLRKNKLLKIFKNNERK